MCPTPQGGGLAKTIQSAEDNFSKLHRVPRVRIIERGGKKLKDLLGKKDLWATTDCNKLDCMICTSQTKKDGSTATCNLESICYQISCDQCKQAGVSADYFGESSRTCYLRGQEHLRGQALKLDDNPLFKHDTIHHSGSRGTYSMRVLRQHPRTLSRQIQEATELQMSSSQIILNSKNEFNGPRLPRITIEVGDRIITEEYRGSRTAQDNMAVSTTPDESPSVGDETTHKKVLEWEARVRMVARLAPRTLQSKRTEQMDHEIKDPAPKRTRTDIENDVDQNWTGAEIDRTTKDPDSSIGKGHNHPGPSTDVTSHLPPSPTLIKDPDSVTAKDPALSSADGAKVASKDIADIAGAPAIPQQDQDPASNTIHRDKPAEVLMTAETTGKDRMKDKKASTTIYGSTDIRYRTVSQALMEGARAAKDVMKAPKKKRTAGAVKGSKGSAVTAADVPRTAQRPASKPNLSKPKEKGQQRPVTADSPPSVQGTQPPIRCPDGIRRQVDLREREGGR